jgi:hypothetical protein
MPEIDWIDVAKKAVDKISIELSEAHRGAIPWHASTNTLLAFDNRGFPKEQIKYLDSRFEKLKIPVRSVAVDDEDSTFVMLIESTDPDQITDILWESFWSAKRPSRTPQSMRKWHEKTERETATQRLSRYDFEMENWWDQQLTGKKGDPALNLHEFVRLFDENRRTINPTRDGLEFIKQAKNRVAIFAKEFGLTADQAIRVYEAFPDALDWKGRNVKEMYEALPPTSTARRTPKKKKVSPPKAAKKKTKKKPVSKKKVKKTPVTKKKVAKKKRPAKKKKKKR